MITKASIYEHRLDNKHELPSNLDSLERVEQIIESLRERFEIPENVYVNILVAISEAIMNAIKHGNKFDCSKRVKLSFKVTKSEYVFVIQDEGAGFDYKNVPDPTHPDNKEKPDGRGIFIINALADRVKYVNKGREIKIYFKRAY